MQVAILAGGQATRLRPLTWQQPKSMLEIKGKPFLEYQLEFLKRSGVTNVVLCLGYLGEHIVNHFGNGGRFGINTQYSYEEEKLLGTAGALKNAADLLDDPFFTLYGDSYLSMDFSAVMSYFLSRNKLALMTVYKNYNQYESSNTVVEGNLVKEFNKQKKTPDMVYIEYGANIFYQKTLDLVPQGQPYSLDDLFYSLIEKQELLAYQIEKRFYQIGSFQGIEEFKEFINRGE